MGQIDIKFNWDVHYAWKIVQSAAEIVSHDLFISTRGQRKGTERKKIISTRTEPTIARQTVDKLPWQHRRIVLLKK